MRSYAGPVLVIVCLTVAFLLGVVFASIGGCR